MKVKINKDLCKLEFPCLMYSPGSDAIFYIYAMGVNRDYPKCYSGVKIHDSSGVLGYSDTWTADLKKYNGSITLEND